MCDEANEQNERLGINGFSGNENKCFPKDPCSLLSVPLAALVTGNDFIYAVHRRHRGRLRRHGSNMVFHSMSKNGLGVIVLLKSFKRRFTVVASNAAPC